MHSYTVSLKRCQSICLAVVLILLAAMLFLAMPAYAEDNSISCCPACQCDPNEQDCCCASQEPKPPIGTPIYLITPKDDVSYTAGQDQNGVKMMTVNSGANGLTYFNVEVTPIVSHDGNETLVYTHSRNGAQRNLSATYGDFDVLTGGSAGFNAQTGDVIKVYMVDSLTNDLDFNPTIFQ